jgi:hypothetical protein
MRQNLYIKILAKMDSRLKNAFGAAGKLKLVPKTLVELAKQLGYIEGVRGPSGGYNATDKGLEFLGLNVEEFSEKEAREKFHDLESLKQRQKEASQQRAAELEDMLIKARKEFTEETPNMFGSKKPTLQQQ